MSTIRKLQPSDAGMVVEHLLRLSSDDRRLRFCGLVGDAFIRAYVDRIDWSRALLFGVVQDHAVRGLGELLLGAGDPPASAEAAFSVERAWRNHGLCHCLMDRVLAAAQVLGVQTAHMYMLGENDPMRHVAGDKGFAYHREDGEIHAALRLDSPATLAAEDGDAGAQAEPVAGAPA